MSVDWIPGILLLIGWISTVVLIIVLSDLIANRGESVIMSSRAPNMQNIPLHTELGTKVREIFEGEKVVLDLDYGLLELRILQYLKDNPDLKKEEPHAQEYDRRAGSPGKPSMGRS